MSTAKESKNIDCKLAQYWYNNHRSSKEGYAKRIFSKESDINYRFSVRECEEFKHSELIGCTVLHLAVTSNRVVDIEFLLSHGASLFVKNQHDCTPLHWAVKNHFESPNDGYFQIKSCCALLLSAQLKSGNYENPSNKNGLTHFHIACMADHADAVEFFLKHGVPVDQTVNEDSPYFPGYAPLHLAARYSALQAVKVLLRYGANVQLKNSEGMTFICKTFQVRIRILQLLSIHNKYFYNSNTVVGNIDTINFLLQNDSYLSDYDALTHFLLACSLTDLSKAELMLQNITDINQALDMDAPKWPGYTALHFAAYYNIDMVKMLVKNGANLLAKDANAVTPLDICLKKYGLEDIHAILSLDSNLRNITMTDRKTKLLSLIYAMKNENLFSNYLEPRLYIINSIVPLDSPIWEGFTPLHLAVMFYQENKSSPPKDERSEKIITKLMEKGININAQDIHGWSPIHLSFRLKPTSCTKLLLNFNNVIENAVDEDNLSHLHILSKLKLRRSFKKLLRNSEDINLAFKGISNLHGISVGATPLHCAASNDKFVNSLLLKEADPYLEDAEGMTAIHHSAGRSNAILSIPNLIDVMVEDLGLSHLHIAIHCNNVTAVEKLLNNGANVNQVLSRRNVLSSIGRSLQNAEDVTPLDLAIAVKNKQIIELLIRRGAEILDDKPVLLHGNTPNELKSVVSFLDLNDSLFKHLEKEIGITSLHLACSRKDIDLIKALIASGANVNAQINVKSRLWPGYTPLHVIINDCNQDENLDQIVGLLLDNDADITLTTSASQQNALFLACERIPANAPSNRYSLLKMIVRAHKDFAINPMTVDRLSFFHVACAIGDIDTVKQFLENGTDVNQRTNSFETANSTCMGDMKGFSPLHFVAVSSNKGVDALTQLQLVDLLLNHGADVHAEDVYGNTPFHCVVRCDYKREDVISRLVRSKANVNRKNIYDKTPLMLLVKSKNNVKAEDIKRFLKVGCIFNVFYPVTDKGLIAKALPWISNEDLIYFFTSSMITFSHPMKTDEMGRTVIHNIVSNTGKRVNDKPKISCYQYLTLITELDKFGCGIDDQDKLGRTALHCAVLFRNVEAISGLLMAGVDVNVTDANGKTAFSHIFETCKVECLEGKSYYEKQSHNQYDHFDIFYIFTIHIKKLLICELDVNQTYENLMFISFEKFNDKDMTVPKLFEEQISQIKSLKIPRSRLALGNFLSEIDAIVAYVTLPKAERNAVDKFFIDDMGGLRNKYKQVADILFLQYRKAAKRIELNESAKLSLNLLSKLLVPNICSSIILKRLTNYDLSSMIEATA